MSNTKFFRLIALAAALILVMGVLFTGCKPGNGDPTAAPSEAPSNTAPASGESTADPTEKLTEEPSSAPTEPDGQSLNMLEEGQIFVCDLDFNGTDDEVSYVINEIDEYDSSVTVTIKLNGETFTYDEIHYAYEVNAAVIDCDSSDSRLEVVLCYAHDSGDYDTVAFRVDDDGAIAVHTLFAGFAGMVDGSNSPIIADGRISMMMSHDILATTYLYADYTITSDGFERVSDCFTYPETVEPVKVINEMPISIINEDGTTTDTTLAVDKTVTPIETDAATYVRVITSDGDTAIIHIHFDEESSFIPMIGDNVQHYYLDVLYAD